MKTVVTSSAMETANSIQGIHQRNFASEGISFTSQNDNQTGQKLVKKVMMKGSLANNSNGAAGHVALTAVR